jgi:GLPGLI family protein
MKKIIFNIFSLILIVVSANSQTTLDTAYLECTYEYTFVFDTIRKNDKFQIRPTSQKDPAMILLIGNKYSKFYSYNIFIRDSVLATKTENELLQLTGNMGEFAQKYPKGESFKVYKNFLEQRIIYTDIQGLYKSLYREQMNLQDWKILEETKVVNNYKCQKAVCTFRGRDYIAWFTHEIPVSDGPWKFNGLPGLIVQIYDTKEHYKFELCSVRKTKKKITFDEQNYKEISIADYIKLYRAYIKNPLSIFDGTIKRDDGTPVKYKSMQYNVMERDIK